MSCRSLTLLILALVSQIGVGLFKAGAQEAALPEYQAKALFLYNFAKFVEWPASKFPDTNAPFVIGIFGPNPFEDHLENAIRGKTLNGRPMKILHVSEISEVAPCHMLFISSGERRRLDDVFRAAEAGNVLTVGESRNFLESGGMINFYLETAETGGARVRFEIEDRTARRASVRISSKLLNLARRPGTDRGQ